MTSQARAANDDQAAVDAAVPRLPTTDGAGLPADNADAPADNADAPADNADAPADNADAPAPVEIGGRAGPEPTRYGDWEMRGRCIDF